VYPFLVCRRACGTHRRVVSILHVSHQLAPVRFKTPDRRQVRALRGHSSLNVSPCAAEAWRFRGAPWGHSCRQDVTWLHKECPSRRRRANVGFMRSAMPPVVILRIGRRPTHGGVRRLARRYSRPYWASSAAEPDNAAWRRYPARRDLHLTSGTEQGTRACTDFHRRYNATFSTRRHAW